MQKKSFYQNRSSLIALISTAIAKKLNWVSDTTSQKLAFAALLHDVVLTKEQSKNQSQLVQSYKNNKKDLSPDLKTYSQHTITASRLMRNWPHCPPDVDIIILQHHEQPDGSGLPYGSEFSRITPLSALFIFSQAMADFIISMNGKKGINEFIIENKEFYSKGEFRKVFEVLSKS